MIDNDVILGKNVRIFNKDLVNLFGCQIGDNSFIGPFVEITRGVVVGKSCVIESHSFICTGVILENNVFIGHGVMFVNDLYPSTKRHVVYPTTLIKRFSSIGSNATILGGITIGECSIVGAGSVVTSDVPDFSIIAGNPGKILRSFPNEQELYDYMKSRQKTAS